MGDAQLTTGTYKDDYIRIVISKVREDLLMYEPDKDKLNLVMNLLERISARGNRNKEFYILSHTKEFRRMGKYLLFISKKIDDGHLSFATLPRNLTDDSDFIRRELLSFLSNPPLKQPVEFQKADLKNGHAVAKTDYDKQDDLTQEEFDVSPDDEEGPSKIFMSLIQSGEHDEDKAFELPGNEPAETKTAVGEEQLKSAEETPDEEEAMILPEEENSSEEEKVESRKPIQKVPDVSPDEGSFTVKRTFTHGYDGENDRLITGEKVNETGALREPDENMALNEIPEDDSSHDNDQVETKEEAAKERIVISNEMSDEIDDYIRKAETEPIETDEDDEVANKEFLEYENEVRICNSYLSGELSKFANGIHMTKDVRTEVISSIIETSQLLAERSRNMSFELISGVYEAISLSFEKIADGKYDISESTVSLLIQGLELVECLIKGEDYFIYKSVLKSLENIRTNLAHEKREREDFQKRSRAKEQLQKELNVRYPSKEQKQIVNSILYQIRNIESVFKEVMSIEGEFHTFESLRTLGGSFNNFKSIVTLSKELNIPLLARLSEGGYNFVKYLCNYKKDPAASENREVLEYLTYTLKSVLLGRQSDDTETFISYLNDPIRIYANQSEHQKNPQQR